MSGYEQCLAGSEATVTEISPCARSSRASVRLRCVPLLSGMAVSVAQTVSREMVKPVSSFIWVTVARNARLRNLSGEV
jgi:hypothetical protein